MPWKYTEEEYREYTRTSWNESAEAYGGLSERLEPVRRALVGRLAPTVGERILDLGTGPGEPALTIAERVGPSGRASGVDLSESMIELARAEAERRGVRNAEFVAMDASDLRFPDSTFDGAVSNFGFQIFTRPDRVAGEVRRVLRPGGRLAASVWSTAERVPFLHAIVGPMLEHAEPDENGYLPTPYETGGPGELTALLEAAGFRNASETREEFRLRFRDAEEYLRAILGGTPIGHSLREEDRDVQTAILRKTRENLERARGPEGIELSAEYVIVGADR